MTTYDTAPVESLSVSLAKVRRLTSSTLAHQSKPAQLLVAIESTISSALPSSSSSSSPLSGPSPTAYFVALLQCLEKACADDVGEEEDLAETENMGEGALIPAVLYLLAIVVPETPASVVVSKIAPLMDCLLPLFESAMDHPPALRSLIQITSAVLLFAPSTVLKSPQARKSWNHQLILCLDHRPKVRHQAQEGVRKVLTTPIPPKVTIGVHPYLSLAREWVMRVLEEESKVGGGKGKKARFQDDVDGKRAIWLVQGLRGWVSVWEGEHLSSLCDRLLALPPTPHLTTQIYSLLAFLLSPSPHDAAPKTTFMISNLPTILDSLLSSPPDLKSNASDVPAYLSALTSSLVKMSLQSPQALSSYLGRALNLFMTILLDPKSSQHVLDAAAHSLGSDGIVRYCITDEMILATVNYARHPPQGDGSRKKQKTPFVTRLIEASADAMASSPLRFGYILDIFSTLVSRLRLRVLPGKEVQIDSEGRAPTAAEELLLPLIASVADLRGEPGFQEREKMDDLIGMCLSVMGVAAVLKALPLNIEPDAKGQTPQPGRAHLLPLIRAHVTNDSFAFFADTFRPLSERVFTRKVEADEAGRANEVKVWEVVVGQIWDCFAGFCDMPRDLQDGLTPAFLTLITNLLYTQPSMLPPLIKGLSLLVTSTQRLAESSAAPEELRKQFGVDQTAAHGNLDYLKGLAKDMVSVLLNVFSKLPRDQRGPVGEVIGNWVGIMKASDVGDTYNTVTSHLAANLHAPGPNDASSSPVSHTMLDLLIIFVPHLSAEQQSAILSSTASETMLEHPDPTVQKKSYRLIKRLLEASRSKQNSKDVTDLVSKIRDAEGGVGPGAQRDRLQLVATIVEALPADRLHLIPELLSEAVLGTKEVNERARDAAFDLLVVMGNRMKAGGWMQSEGHEQDEDMGDGDATVQASAAEFVTMVAAGLTGTTPHMISASITALSRVVFEYKDDIPTTTLSELVSTSAVFLASKNREIVKSALGFVKLLIITLPPNLVSTHLPSLVPALLGWVHDHKNHFKQKTVHIFERMIRRFGYDEVYGFAPAGGERKVLEGIKKRKDRAKRKKAAAQDDEGDGAEVPKASAGNAFEDVLYNSDSESDDGDESEEEQSRGRNGRQKQKQRQRGEATAGYIRQEWDQPLDLLSRSIAGGVSKVKPNAPKRQPGQDASHFKTDKLGRMVVPDDAEPSGESDDGGAGAAFVSSGRGVDGQIRDARGGVKFSRNTKKAREEDMDMDDDRPSRRNGLAGNDSAAERARMVKEKRTKKMKAKLGEEFRAKRGGGDIKRNGGPDPFSYVSLGQANIKRGAGRVNLTNKKRGSRK